MGGLTIKRCCVQGLLLWTLSSVFVTPRMAAADLLPAGIGSVDIGVRQFANQTNVYDGGGDRVALGHRYSRSLSGDALRDGAGGANLRELASGLDRLAPPGARSPSLTDQLDLGTVAPVGTAEVKSQYLGIGYGLTSKWTVFGYVPYVEAKTSASLQVSGSNNALAVKDRLGGYAFGSLSQGLDQAARLTATDLASQLSANGYQALGEWQKSGVGDSVIGARTATSAALGRTAIGSLAVTPNISLPTGAIAPTNNLQAISFGSGLYGIGAEVEPSVSYQRGMLKAALPVAYTHFLPGSVEKRLPEGGETFVAPERTTQVTYARGDDVDVAAAVGSRRGVLSGELRRGVKRHLGDRYRGSLSGNYAVLSEETDALQHYAAAAIRVDTSEPFLRKAFVAPIVLEIGAFQTISGYNVTDERYIEAAVGTYFGSSKR